MTINAHCLLNDVTTDIELAQQSREMEALLARCTDAEFAELARLVAAKQQSFATVQPLQAQASNASNASPEPAPVVDMQSSGDDLEDGEVGSSSEPLTPPAYLSFGRMSPVTRARQKHELLSGQYLMLGDGYDTDNINKDAGILRFETHRRAFAGMMESLRPAKVLPPSNTTQSSSAMPTVPITAAQPSTDRAQYLAKLQAAKNKKTEIPKAPISATTAMSAPKAKKCVDPKKNELLRQKLAALKAGQSIPRQGPGSGLVAGSMIATDPNAFLDSLTLSRHEATMSPTNDLTPSSDDPSAASGLLTAQAVRKRSALPDFDSALSSKSKPFDRGANDYHKQQLVIQVSDESESELDDESDDGVDLQYTNTKSLGNTASISSSTSGTPRIATPSSLAYAKKLQEIELAKRQIAEKEERARSRAEAPRTPTADSPAAYMPPMPPSANAGAIGIIPGLTTLGPIDDPALDKIDEDLNMNDEDIEDDEDFDDIYDMVGPETIAPAHAANDAVVDCPDESSGTDADDEDQGAIMTADDNIDTEMEDTEDFYDDGNESVVGQNQPASIALVTAVDAGSGSAVLDTTAPDEQETAASEAQFHAEDTFAAPDATKSRSAAAVAAAVASQGSISTDGSDSDASMDISDSEANSDEEASPVAPPVQSVVSSTAAKASLNDVHNEDEEEPEPARYPLKAKWVAKSVYKPYESPLTYFQARRPQLDQVALESANRRPSFHKIDSHTPICPTETSGVLCTSTDCDYQHFKDMDLGQS